MKPLPIRWKISVWSAGFTAFALLVFAAGSLFSLYEAQLETVDIAVDAQFQRFVASAGKDSSGGGWQEQYVNGTRVLFYLIQEEDHRQFGPTDVSAPVVTRALNSRKLKTVKDGDNYWRVMSFHEGAQPVVLAFELVEVREQVMELVGAFSVMLPLVIALTAIGAWLVAGRVLVPIRTATAAAREIGADALDRRLPLTIADDEIGQLTQVINSMLDRLEKGLRQAERFASDASHELRTPLTIMKGEIEELLGRGSLPVDVEEKLVSQQEEIARLDAITERLLLLARFDSGASPLARTALDFSALVQEACDDIEPIASSLGLTMTFSVAPSIMLSGDGVLLRRVVLNLLDNAIKFSGPEGHVTCDLERIQELAKLTVSNTGPGIPEESRGRIFERFFRADAARVRSGHGLGLSLCREIARAHDGEIELMAGDAEGRTTFVVTLPGSPE